METGDPDDFITLLLLLGHPSVDLRAVTLVPGTPDQIGFVRYVLQRFQRNDMPLGVFRKDAKPALSSFHTRVYEDAAIKPCFDAEDGSEVLITNCDAETTLVCGGPLTNLAAAIKTGRFNLGRLVAQGGFAGDNVVPREKRLDKFNGRTTCPTFNLGADIAAAHTVLSSQCIKEKYFVSKNVCHGVLYTMELHERVKSIKDYSQSLTEIYHAMDVYLSRQRKKGKALHDPLAACCGIDLTVAEWLDVELYMDDRNHQWGSRPSHKPNVKIIIDYDHEKFLSIFLAYASLSTD